MINSGSNQNVKAGYPVINADGLLGRIVDIGRSSARVLLASDLNSRIPVVVGANGVRAILAGDNGPEPRLIYLPDGAKIAVGDDVATPGAGGLFPAGLRIGAVTGDLAHPRIMMRANLDRLEYVSVLFFDNPSRALADEEGGEIAGHQVRNGVSPDTRRSAGGRDGGEVRPSGSADRRTFRRRGRSSSHRSAPLRC